MPAFDRLPDRRQMFVRHLPACGFNRTAAAREAGYAYPRQEGKRLLADATVQDAVAEYVAPMLRELETDADRVLYELAAVAFSDITAYAEWDETGEVTSFTPSSRLTQAQRAAVRKIEYRRIEREGRVETRLKVELHQKLPALRLMARITQLVKERNPIIAQILAYIQNMPVELLEETVREGTPAMRALLESRGYRVGGEGSEP